MSQASNKVRWCLKKAQKELEEAGLHRGLVKVEPDPGLAEKHIRKAEHNLGAALYFSDGGYSDWSASAFFYCLYHCFLSILRRHGYESRNQECTIAAIEVLAEEGRIALDRRFVDLLKIAKPRDMDHSMTKVREDFQYGVEVEFERNWEFAELVSRCRELIDVTRQIVHG